MTVLSARELRKDFGGVRAVDGVSFDLAAGEILALIGPNGAGKTTCFNLLNGQLRPDAGAVILVGQDITGHLPHDVARLGIGRTFQITATFASMTVRENVQTALLAHHRGLADLWTPAVRRYVSEADTLLAQVDMTDQADRACGVLAYGDLKRVEFAVALAASPRVLLMDEPTAGMAAAERRALMELVTRLARASGTAVLFTEHDMDVVFGHADRIIVLDRGKVIADGAPTAVRADRAVQDVYLGTGAA
jgi:branched-chain amino acid transport system ATP-binding protein